MLHVVVIAMAKPASVAKLQQEQDLRIQSSNQQDHTLLVLPASTPASWLSSN